MHDTPTVPRRLEGPQNVCSVNQNTKGDARDRPDNEARDHPGNDASESRLTRNRNRKIVGYDTKKLPPSALEALEWYSVNGPNGAVEKVGPIIDKIKEK
ncbi:hypothetical protein E4U13_006561 [Claviceps humidiphila]|uniref:Uncharacterized protein n=1 Tax=Claviceps humidiphila TaxID=1294629 RepID=A0A9P7PV06_9HYPO|nr:hypothetical protein E4U13_006561 [Claviceps humidiphila]